MKRLILNSKFSISFLFLLSLLSIVLIELYIYQEKKDCKEQAFQRLTNAFEGLESVGSVLGCQFYNKDIERFDIGPSQIPDFPQNDTNDSEKKYWRKELKDIGAFFEVTKQPWSFDGLHTTWNIPLDDKGTVGWGIQEFYLRPSYIGVRKGYQASREEMHKAVLLAFEQIPYDNTIINQIHDNAICYKNKFYHVASEGVAYAEISNFHNSGVMDVLPIYQNGKFSGNYNYAHIDIGNYRIFVTYTKWLGWRPWLEDDEVLKERLKYYIFIVLPIIVLIVIVIVKTLSKKNRYKKIFKKGATERIIELCSSYTPISKNEIQESRELLNMVISEESETKKIELIDQICNNANLSLLSEEEIEILLKKCSLQQYIKRPSLFAVANEINSILISKQLITATKYNKLLSLFNKLSSTKKS